jgi:lipoprotein-anchoring transpeptidase ErfK/SrfK
MSDQTLQRSNWTNGCIALINADMDELWESVEPGTPIEIRP